MKILSLSLDPLVLQKESVVASRSVRYGSVTESYMVIVPSRKAEVVTLSSNTLVYGTGGNFKLMQLWRMYIIARNNIRQNGCEVVTSQDTYYLGFIAWVLAYTNHCGLEVQVQGIEKLNFFRKMLSRFVLSRADSIRVVSTRLKKRLVSEFGIKTDRMMVIPIYVDVSSLRLYTASLSEEERVKLDEQNKKFQNKYRGHFNIVSVNRLVPIKNIPMQLQAVQVLSVQFPQILLHIVGDGPLRSYLELEVERLGISKHVVLHGFKSDFELSPFFTQSDCFVLTSDYEGYGMVIVEAATAGLPIIMTDVGCAGEVIIDGKSGLIIPPQDMQALIRALQEVIEDEVLRGHLKEGALKTVVELPSFDIVIEKYKASWQQALENRTKNNILF